MEMTPKGYERAMDKLTPEHLDSPLDEVVAPKEEPKAEVVAPTESVPEKPIEATPAVADKQPEEEEKVPKSRFLTMHQRAVEAEKALRQFEAERANQPVHQEPIPDDEELRKHYVDLFGENEITEKIYRAELARMNSIEEKAAERAYERLSQREQVEQETINQRVESFDHAFEELAIAEGKTDFTDEEQVAILDIVEKYSPKDNNGKLIGDYLMPLDNAYEIYKLNSEPAIQAKKVERNAVAALQGARSEGTPSNSSDAEWRPGQDRRWWNKV